MIAKLPLGPPSCQCTTLSCPRTCSTIAGESASAPSMRREKHARMNSKVCLPVGLLRG